MLARGQEEKDMPKVDVPAVERIIADTIRPLLRKYGSVEPPFGGLEALLSGLRLMMTMSAENAGVPSFLIE